MFFIKNPIERVLGESECVINGRTVKKQDCCYDIPLLDSLQCQLRSETIRDQVCTIGGFCFFFVPLQYLLSCMQVMNSHCLDGGLMGDYCDGTNYSQSELFQEHPCALQIQLYYDEVEVVNPIGSKVNTHKLGMTA